jgi:TP901 family phage tail tape measure protein
MPTTDLIAELSAIDQFLARIAKDAGIAYNNLRHFSRGLQIGGGFDPAILAKGLSGFKTLVVDLQAVTAQLRQMGTTSDAALLKVQERLQNIAALTRAIPASQGGGGMFASYYGPRQPRTSTIPPITNTSLLTSLEQRIIAGERETKRVQSLINATKFGTGPFAGAARTPSSLAAERAEVLRRIGTSDNYRGPQLGTSVQSRLAYYTAPGGEMLESGAASGRIAARQTARMLQQMEIDRNRMTGQPAAVSPYYGPPMGSFEVSARIQRNRAMWAPGAAVGGGGAAADGAVAPIASRWGAKAEELFKAKPLVSAAGLEGGARAVENLTAKLRAYGIENARVLKVSGDLGSGIRRVTLGAMDQAGNIQRVTAHMDKYGSILTDTQKRFRTFGDSILRNVAEVAKWSIATALIFGPMQKFNELMTQAKQVQTELADISIVTGKNISDLSATFEAANIIATETSSTLEGVLHGFGLAYAATGGVSNQIERQIQAQGLLKDSMILSKLAGIDQAQALDTLVGALRQTDQELSDGGKLLDQWVMVARNAQVSINTLASSYAIVGSAATDAGMSAEELNAIIGTLAESTKLSADEVGNAIRGFVAGFQTDKSEAMLARYGIAVRNTNGDLRDFMDITREIAVKSQQGVLSEKDVSAITNAVGGGYRRGAQFAALIKNYQRALELVDIQQGSSGQAAKALEIRMTTLDSATVRLGNAFTVLAQTLGGEGGILNFFTKLTDAGTMVINMLSGVTNALGGATVPLTIFTALMGASKLGTMQSVLYRQAPTFLRRMAGAAVVPQQLDLFSKEGRSALGAPLPKTTYAPMGWGESLGNINRKATELLDRKTLGGLGKKFQAWGMIVPGMLAGSQAKEGIGSYMAGKPEEGGRQLVGAGASIAGAIAGGLITAGNPIGISIGSAIATAFYKGVLDQPIDLGSALAQLEAEKRRNAGAPPEPGAPVGPTAIESYVEKLPFIQRIQLGLASAAATVAKTISPQRYAETYGTEVAPMPGVLAVQGAAGYGTQRGATGIEGLINKINPFNTPELAGINKIIEDALASGTVAGVKGIGTTRVEDMESRNVEIIRASADEAAKVLIERLREQLITGEITGSTFKSSREQIGNVAASAGSIMTGFQLTGMNVSNQQLISTLLNLQPEEITMIGTLAGGIKEMTGDLEDLQRQKSTATGDQLADIEAKIKAITEALPLAKGEFEDLWNATAAAASIRNLNILPIVDVNMTPEEARATEARALELQKEYLINEMMLSPEQAELVIKNNKEQMLRISDAGGNFLDYFRSKASGEFWGQAQQEKAPMAGKKTQWADWREQGVTMGQAASIEQQSKTIGDALMAAIPGLGWEQEPYAIATVDGIYEGNLYAQIANMLLQDIKKLNEEQLEGVFNLPGDMAAAIPMTGQVYFGKSSYGQAGGEEASLQKLIDAILALVPKVTPSAVGTDTYVQEAGNNAAAEQNAIDNMRLGANQGAQLPGQTKIAPGWFQYLAEKRRRDALATPGAYSGAEPKGLPYYGDSEGFTGSEPKAGGLYEPTPAKKYPGGPIGVPGGYQGNAESIGAAVANSLAPLFATLGSMIGGGTGGGLGSMDLGTIISQAFPDSIPITNKVNLETQNIIYIDGTKVMDALNKRQFSDIKVAKRSAGVVGFTVS